MSSIQKFAQGIWLGAAIIIPILLSDPCRGFTQSFLKPEVVLYTENDVLKCDRRGFKFP